MNSLWLSKAQAQAIIHHALADLPNECCGLLSGQGRHVQQTIPIPNIAHNPKMHYRMDEKALARHLPELVSNGQDIIGFYHSHPEGQPIFSETDRQESLWDNHIHLIVGIKGKSPRFAAWKTDRGRVVSINIQSDKEPTAVHDRTLSNAQKIAIILGGMITLTVMLAVSLNLLPPAPSIP